MSRLFPQDADEFRKQWKKILLKDGTKIDLFFSAHREEWVAEFFVPHDRRNTLGNKLAAWNGICDPSRKDLIRRLRVEIAREWNPKLDKVAKRVMRSQFKAPEYPARKA